MPGISLAAPDNPLSLLPAHAGSVPAGSYQPFGGTSGAGPHVAAAVALLRQHFPGEDANAIRTRLTTHARHDSYATPEAVTTYGAGKLDLSGAIELGTASTTRPTVVLNGPDHTTLGDDAMLTPVVNAEGAADGIRIRWDFDYDGHPDTDWVAVAPNTVHATALGPIDVRVEVRDANGAVSAGTHRVLVVRALAATDAGADVRPSDGGTAIGVGGAGCSCRAGGSPPARPVWAAWFFALVFAARRRRRGS
jgi:MYXO-CTERM domain-containing protein